jgi:hypothetical protein
MNYRCVLCSADLRNPAGLAPWCPACDSCAELYYRIQRDKSAKKSSMFSGQNEQSENFDRISVDESADECTIEA